MTAATRPLLQVQDLRVSFRMGEAAPGETGARVIEAVGRGDTGVSFDVPAHATVALVGESGSGKSVSAMSVVGLLPRNAITRGRVPPAWAWPQACRFHQRCAHAAASCSQFEPAMAEGVRCLRSLQPAQAVRTVEEAA